MRIYHLRFCLRSSLCIVLMHVFMPLFSQNENYRDKIIIQSTPLGGRIHLLYCTGGFGGGKVAASIGDEGILLVDDMYAWMAPKLESSLKAIADKPLRMIINTHFHRDHIEGNTALRKSAIILAHENVVKQLLKNSKDSVLTQQMMPTVTFNDHVRIVFNGEEINVIHFPNSHTDSDVVVHFTKSKVLHLGDMFFFGMFPAVYASGGGDIKQLINSLEKILVEIPADVKVIPGHGDVATMQDLANYVTMLKTTSRIVEEGIRQGKSLEQLKHEKVLSAYDTLGEGGAQTTDQYLTMLHQLLIKK